MKIKQDFTTNSSSSSFIILSKEKLDKNSREIRDIFQKLVGSSRMFPHLAAEVAEEFISYMDNVTLKDYLYDHYNVETVDELKKSERDYIDGIGSKILAYASFYHYIYEGSFSDDDSTDRLGALLCDADIDYKDDNILIYKSGGY